MHLSMFHENLHALLHMLLHAHIAESHYGSHRMSELQEVRQKILLIEREADDAKKKDNTDLLILYQRQLATLREKEERLAKEAATAGGICTLPSHPTHLPCPLPYPTYAHVPLPHMPNPRAHIHPQPTYAHSTTRTHIPQVHHMPPHFPTRPSLIDRCSAHMHPPIPLQPTCPYSVPLQPTPFPRQPLQHTYVHAPPPYFPLDLI